MRPYAARAAAVAALLVLTSSAWQVLTGNQIVRNLGDLAQFGSIVFQVLAPLTLAAIGFFAALTTAADVAYEKDRRTFDLLLLTNLSNVELVLGKLCAALLGTANVLAAVVPVFFALVLLGGTSLTQVCGVLAVTAAAMATAGSLGSTIALQREKTFQTLAATVLAIVVWTGIWAVVDRGALGSHFGSISAANLAATASPWHALQAVMPPFGAPQFAVGPFRSPLAAHLICAAALTAMLNTWAILRVRIWNPTRELMPRNETDPALAAAPHRWSLSALRESTAANRAASGIAEGATTAVAARGLRRTRQVWNNPVLWREMMTWAYGRKVLFLRAVFLLLWLGAVVVAWRTTLGRIPTADEAATPLVPVAVLALLLCNMQAVTAVTSERDARALDLLLVTDLTPREFVFGKLGGIFYNAKEAVLLPALACLLLWWRGVIGGETCTLLLVGWLTIATFAAVLGLHVGLNYAESRTAIGVSAATIFFLVVGIAVSMRLMVAFRGSFQAQLQPFLATIVGGGVGLYAALGRRNPSPAITLAAFTLPLATFYAITSYLSSLPLAAFLAVVGACGFATTALLVPAIFEFDVATGRTTGGHEES